MAIYDFLGLLDLIFLYSSYHPKMGHVVGDVDDVMWFNATSDPPQQ
jgi:hypothetical protein